MKIIFLFAALIFGTGSTVVCQESVLIRTSPADNSGRFEVIQPSYDNTTTFRLDKYTGRVHRLATCPKDDSLGSDKCWKEMNVIDLPKIGAANRPRYQIVINVPLKLIMLMQTDTGQSWQYGIEPMDRWYPFTECSERVINACLWKPGE
ncbi:MAG: hypothetical protein ABJB40_10355 [Acidobacteriota bacterium]